MAKYIDLPNLKENLTNFLNKKINPIYAKKTEIPSNVSELNNDKSYQTAEEVDQAITDGVAKIVAGAPEDFDTLKEMSDWISSHETSAAAMNSAISDNSVAIANHTSNSDIHVTKEEKTKWNKLDSDLKDGTIIVAEATKATQDAQGNVINETYAKKTEVPHGTVVDDALSSTSTNPVQNKVVKAEFDKVGSNLSDLKYEEVAGGKNLATVIIPSISNNKIIFTKKDDSTLIANGGNYSDGIGISKGFLAKAGITYTAQIITDLQLGMFIWNSDEKILMTPITHNKEITFSVTKDTNISIAIIDDSNLTFNNTEIKIQLEEGTVATDYEPYIPSVKMLAEEVNQQKNDLSDLKDGTTPAAKAVADEDGNNIKSTYATKTELDAKANITNPVFEGSFSMGRKEDSTVGKRSHSEGYNTTASDSNTHAEGSGTKAINANAHAEGRNTTASGLNTHAEGNNTTASGSYSHAEGSATKAERDCAHSEGNGTTASGMNSHAEGSNTKASGHSGHSEGYKTTALDYQHAGGHYNNTTTATISTYTGTGTGTSFVIGNGTENALSNAFRINDNGEVFAKSATISTGADYAEYFEWEDENPEKEDRRGYFVTLNNKKIKLAQPGDYILGIVSGFPSVIGNGDEEWMGRYIFDDFGTPIYEEFVYEDLITGEKKTGTKWKENPDYDKERPYIQRSERPEWDAVGMLGVLSVRDDGTCVSNKYCKITDGSIATLSDDKSDYRVIRRINDNVVEIVFR